MKTIDFEEVDLSKVADEGGNEPESQDYDAGDHLEVNYGGGEKGVIHDYAEEELHQVPKEALHTIDDDKLPYLVSDLAPSANIVPLDKFRLEDIDVSSLGDLPKLVSGVGNYENNPPMPAIGSDGHTGPGEGGKSPVQLDSEEERKVQGALQLWGFNMVASNKVFLLKSLIIILMVDQSQTADGM